MISKMLMTSFILMLKALLIYVIGFSTSHFIDIKQSSFKKYYIGLWISCETYLSIKDLSACQDSVEFFNLGDRVWFKASRATSILGIIFLCAALICAGLKLFVFKGKKCILDAAIGMTFVAVVFILIASIAFTHNDDDHFGALGLYFDYGYSFDLTIVGMCTAVIAGVFMVVDYNTGLHIDDGQVANY